MVEVKKINKNTPDKSHPIQWDSVTTVMLPKRIIEIKSLVF